MTDQVHSLRNWRSLAWSSLALLLAWQVTAESLAAYLAEAAPIAALWLHPGQPSALVDLADQAFHATADLPADILANHGDERVPQGEDISASAMQRSDGPSEHIQGFDHPFSVFETIGPNQSITRPTAPANAPAMRRWLELALLNQPINAQALRMLGQLAESDGDDANALKFMEAAGRLSLHDQAATFWLMRKSAQVGDDKSVIYYANLLLRTTPELGAAAMPFLAQIAEEKGAQGLLTALLASHPPWRGQFFSALPNYVTDARIPLQLLMALRTSATPPSATEVGGYVNFLITRKLYDLAYYTWLQFLPPEELRNAGFLFNGDFSVRPSGSPFDWQIASGAGVTVDIVPRGDNGGAHALMVEFEFGRVEYQSVHELVMLAEGTYEFKGEYKGNLIGPRGLKWRIACASGAGAPLGESPMILGVANTWKPVTFEFAVPASGCPAQYVRLDLDARMASEQFISGSMLFDQLQIARVANPS